MTNATTLPLIDEDPYRDLCASNSPEFAPGSVLGGSYRLIRRLGRGGMGDIHLASHERLPGRFVVKVLSPELVGEADSLARFHQEAAVIANIRHPNVVHVVDFNFTPTGMPYLVMEYLPGRDLSEILISTPLLPAGQVSSIVRQVACAMDATHKLGIVHRDLKPENIMVVPCDGQGELVKVIDFGISKTAWCKDVTNGPQLMGTPEFMSPEQAEGRHDDVSPQSDQFALAVIAYLLLTGRTPWGVSDPLEVLDCVVNRGPMPLANDSSWPSVEAVLFQAMAKTPENRFSSTLVFWHALNQAMARDGLLAPVGTPHPLYPPPDADVSLAACDDDQNDHAITIRLPRVQRRAWDTMALVVVLAFGTGLGFVDGPGLRARIEKGWNGLRGGAARAVKYSTEEGSPRVPFRWISGLVAPPPVDTLPTL